MWKQQLPIGKLFLMTILPICHYGHAFFEKRFDFFYSLFIELMITILKKVNYRLIMFTIKINMSLFNFINRIDILLVITTRRIWFIATSAWRFLASALLAGL